MATQRSRRRSRARLASYPWQDLDDPALLRLRFRDLRLRLEDSRVWPDIERLGLELERRGIRFRPHYWLSTEWFSPDGVPGIAVPFFAAHARLGRLERRMMGDVEGGNSNWRLRILRHEAGHALDTAYGLRRRADWREVFGPASKRYPKDYSVRPGSRRFVLHLGHWYAQSHPTEDFAETFAVWMQPKARWRREYAGWPALEKLEYVDALMDEIAGRPARHRDRSIIAPLAKNGRTLGEHYRRRTNVYEHIDKRYDTWLERAFAARPARPRALRARTFLREQRGDLKRALLRRTPAGPYLIEHVLERVAARARQLDLVLRGSRRESRAPVIGLHERVIADVLHRNREKYVL